MSAVNAAGVDMRAFVKALRGERYRSFLLHDAPLRGKSAFARKLADLEGGVYLDVLGLVADSPNLRSRVDTLDSGLLKSLALQAAGERVPLVIVDEFDFLLPVWGGEIAQVLEIVRKLSVAETPAVVGFVMQTLPALEQANLTTPSGKSRILTLEDVKPL
jgi:hypothetical protein